MKTLELIIRLIIKIIIEIRSRINDEKIIEESFVIIAWIFCIDKYIGE